MCSVYAVAQGLARIGVDVELAQSIAGAAVAIRREHEARALLRDVSVVLGGFGGVGELLHPCLPLPSITVYLYSDLLADALPTLACRRRRRGWVWWWRVASPVALHSELARAGAHLMTGGQI
jgi:hypothetical protein